MEQILDSRTKNGKQEVLVKWLGYDTAPTWEPLSAFFSPELHDFCAERGLDIHML